MYDMIIVGAGASGVMCAIQASNSGKSVLLIDTNNIPAKKLMVTGNGKCNLTNVNTNSNKYNTNIDKYLSRFDVKDTMSFFADLGLLMHTDNEGRVYPFSNNARSVIDVLCERLDKNKVTFVGEQKVVKIEKLQDEYNVLTESDSFVSKSVVLATGGFDQTKLIKKSKLYPSLCALKTNEHYKKLSGVRLSDVVVTASCCGKTMTDRGEVLFKDEGLSGIVVFNISSLFARMKKYSGIINIDLMPDYDFKDVKRLLTARLKNCDINNIFVGWFSDEVSKLIISKSGVRSLSKDNVDILAKSIKSLKFDVVGYYDNNQVVSGGVSLDDLNDNLQSKQNSGLYVIGECCDVDGECGGYNLQWAWTSGWIAGSAI